MRIKALITGATLAAMAMASTALTLGRARGAAWIGQPLDLVISIQLDPGQTDTNVCPEAEVFHGDSRLDGSRVRVAVEPVKDTDTVNLRVISSTLIDEPVVTVYLRAGCTQRVARRFVMLADFPPDATATRNVTPVAPAVPLVVAAESPAASPPTAANTVPSAAPVPSASTANGATASVSQTTGVAAPAPVAIATNSPSTGVQTSAATGVEKAAQPPAKPALRAAPVPKPVVAPEAAPTIPMAPSKPAAPASTAAPTKPVTPTPPASAATPNAATPSPAKAAAKPANTAAANDGKPRLKLDPLDSSTAKPAEPVPATANGDKGTPTPDAKHMEELQASVKTLLEQSAKNEATLLALRERLEKAETERVSMGVVYALVAVLLAALAALLFAWNRRRQSWRDELDDDAPAVAYQQPQGRHHSPDDVLDAGISVQHLESRH